MLKNSVSVPSKVFLLGEYAILDGSPAILSTFSPRFNLSPGAEGDPANFHPDSPAGRLQKSHPSSLWEGNWDYHDPHRHVGGFGGSTAEFLLSHAISKMSQGMSLEPDHMWDAWKRYREINGLASGADLITQWLGGTTLVDIDNERAQRLHLGEMDCAILAFSAGHQQNRKVKTHDHLERLTLSKGIFKGQFKGLHEIVQAGYDAILRQNSQDFGDSMNQYGDLLRAMGLEISETTDDRAALSKVPGVRAVKGTGALQADGILVLVDSEHLGRKEEIIEAVEARDLRLVCRDLLVPEPGLMIE